MVKFQYAVLIGAERNGEYIATVHSHTTIQPNVKAVMNWVKEEDLLAKDEGYEEFVEEINIIEVIYNERDNRKVSTLRWLWDLFWGR